jgi:hypothetical protein
MIDRVLLGLLVFTRLARVKKSRLGHERFIGAKLGQHGQYRCSLIFNIRKYFNYVEFLKTAFYSLEYIPLRRSDYCFSFLNCHDAYVAKLYMYNI